MNRQSKYEDKLRERGYQRVCVWVPSENAERLKKYANRLRKQAEKKQ